MFNIPELYSYSSRVRRRFANKLSEIPWDKVIENKEASWYSMRNILVHMIDNEDWIINWAIHEKSAEYRRLKKAEEYSDMKQVIEHMNEVEEKTRSYLEGVSGNEEEFKRRINLVFPSGKSVGMSVEDAMFQSFTEQLYHLGELIALLWQENIEPPQMQWFNNNPRNDSKTS